MSHNLPLSPLPEEFTLRQPVRKGSEHDSQLQVTYEQKSPSTTKMSSEPLAYPPLQSHDLNLDLMGNSEGGYDQYLDMLMKKYN